MSHVALKPKDLVTMLPGLWNNGVHVLVMEKLLPLARKHFVHFVIRAGFDFTANILVSEKFHNERSTDPNLKLVDLESIVKFNTWIVLPDDIRYPRALKKCHSALGFVWLQTVAIGLSWISKTVANKVDFDNLVQSYPDASKNVGENEIAVVHDKIGQLLESESVPDDNDDDFMDMILPSSAETDSAESP